MRNNTTQWEEEYRLVRPAVEGDEIAWNTLYAKAHKRVIAVVHQNNTEGLLNNCDIEEITNETFTRCYAKLNTFEGRSLFSTRVCAFAKYISLNTKYKKISLQRKSIIYKNYLTPLYERSDPLMQLIYKERNLCLWLAFCALSPLHRTLLCYIVLDGYKITEAQTAFGISRRIVQDELSVAKTLLRKHFIALYKNKRLR